MHEAVERLRSGEIGTVTMSKAWNIQRRGNQGRYEPSEPPAGLDFDMWVGPSPMVPFRSSVVGDWHRMYAFGTGDMGNNDGVHDIDYARWGLGVNTHPTRIVALGGRYVFDDDPEFPDTQTVAFEYPGDGKPGSIRQLIYEQRMWSPNYPYNVDSGVEFYGTKGQMFLSRRGKIQILDSRNQRVTVPQPKGAPDISMHHENFLSAIRGDRQPNASATDAHLTSALCHLGNIATRLGRALQFDPEKELFVGDAEATKSVTRTYRAGHWAVPRGV
jgi:predicted dehydrogenase